MFKVPNYAQPAVRCAIALGVLALLIAPVRAAEPAAEMPRKVAFLGVLFQNDNEGYQPTSDAERARMAAVEGQFKTALEKSGRYAFVAIPTDLKAKIDSGQPVGACGGCEVEYGKAAGSDTIAWIGVQKISNLIMNMNVFIGDVSTANMLFQHSVDIRGNTDESWARSMAYLLNNYLLVAAPAGAG